MNGEMRFKAILKTITSSGNKRSVKLDVDASVSLDALEMYKDQPCWFTVSVMSPEDDVVEVLMDGTTGEILG